MNIRPEKPSDVETIHKIHASEFPGDEEARLVDRLRTDGKAVISLVAENDEGEIIGHILFSPVSIDPPIPARGLGLAPLAVRRSYQNVGVGSALCRAGLDECRRLGYDYAVVLGGPDYYNRFGFVPASNFNLGNDYNAGDEFMAIELTPGCLQGIHGTVHYSEEFAGLS